MPVADQAEVRPVKRCAVHLPTVIACIVCGVAIVCIVCGMVCAVHGQHRLRQIAP